MATLRSREEVIPLLEIHEDNMVGGSGDSKRLYHSAVYEALLEADAAGEPVYWERAGEIRFVPPAIYLDALELARHVSELVRLGNRHGKTLARAMHDRGLLRWSQCVRLIPETEFEPAHYQVQNPTKMVPGIDTPATEACPAPDCP